MRCELDPATTGPVELKLDQVYQEPPFKETERVKLVEIESKLLTQFHGKPMRLRAGVVLPPSFAEEPDRKYPVVYEIPGFGGDHFVALGAWPRASRPTSAGVEMIYVVLDPNCRLGHHVFADSANNGPCGQALVEELIPHIEKTFRGIGEPAARFVTGHSSGGWSSLWLQVTYPDFFGGSGPRRPTRSTSATSSASTSTAGREHVHRRARASRGRIARRGGKPVALLPAVLGHGGGHGPRRAARLVRGRLQPARPGRQAAPALGPQDRRDRRRGRPSLGEVRHPPGAGAELEDARPEARGKLHVYMGDEDTFYLEGATRLLKESLAKLGSDAVVEMFPARTTAR